MQKEIDIFISYSRKDYIDEALNPLAGNVITELKKRLIENNVSFWIDEDGIYSGDAFAQIIARNIKKCKIFVFVSSVNSNSSSWTSNEIATAVEYKKVIIPLRIDDSAYHEDIVLYLAKLDYIACYVDMKKGMERLMDSILRYKREWENERLVALRKQEEQERMEREEEDKRKRIFMEEQEKKERERLAAIALEKKRREEELTMILSQIFELEKTETTLECKKDDIDKEKKNIEREISLIHKRLEHLEIRRSVLESQLTGSNKTPTPQEHDALEINGMRNNIIIDKAKALFSSLSKGCQKISLLFTVSRKTLAFILASVLVLLMFWGIWPLIKRVIDANSTSSPIAKLNSVIPVENDSVYGIETIDKINWKQLNVRLSDNDTQLHKVSFALMLCTSGKNDYLGETYEYNRAKANENGIYFASYHLLNVKSTWKLATGENQAENFISRVGKLHTRELPPVLSIPVIEKEDAEIARERCTDWLKIVKEQYGVKPIVFVGQSTFEDYVKKWELDNIIWMPTVNPSVSSIKFQKWHYKKVRFYNDTIPQEKESVAGRLSVYLGTYKDFISIFGDK